MARPFRIEYEHAFYHVIARGQRGERIFLDARDRGCFLNKLAIIVKRHHVRVHAYALMDTHYHLLLETPDANLARAMHDLNSSYANWFRVKHALLGPVFAGRYKAILVEKEEYHLVLSAYIHLNPVRAGVVGSAEEFQWSSYRDYVGGRKTQAFLYTEGILSKFRNHAGYRDYVEGIMRGDASINKEELAGVNSLLGSDGFIRRALAALPEKKKGDRIQVGVSALGRIAPDDVLESIMMKFRVGEKEVLDHRKGNAHRKLLLFMLCRHTGLRLDEIGRLAGMKGKTVSELVRSFTIEVEEKKGIKRMAEELEGELSKRALLRVPHQHQHF
jgi:REP element-mobilizing transposase RayT